MLAHIGTGVLVIIPGSLRPLEVSHILGLPACNHGLVGRKFFGWKGYRNDMLVQNWHFQKALSEPSAFLVSTNKDVRVNETLRLKGSF